MTLIISTISLGVVVPTLKEEKLMQTNIGQIILLVAVIADLVTMILLAVFSSIYGDGTGTCGCSYYYLRQVFFFIYLAGYLRQSPFFSPCQKERCKLGQEPSLLSL